MQNNLSKIGVTVGQNDRLEETLRGILPPEEIIMDKDERAFYSTDVYSRGKTPAIVIRPKNKDLLAKAVNAISEAGYAVIPRGGGMSYTGGYRPVREDTVTVDLRQLDQIVEINEEDMYKTSRFKVTILRYFLWL
jgi:glycolate oxidase